MIKACDAIFTVLTRDGVECFFTSAGGSPLDRAAAKKNVRTVVAKHAAFLAMGYAQAGRRLGLCGGGTDALPGIAAAQHAAVPVLLLSAPGDRDVVALYQHVTSRSVLLADTRQAADVTEWLVSTALDGRGPVHLSVPKRAAGTSATVPPVVGRAPLTPDGETVTALARALTDARRPAILAGHGVHRAAGFAALRQVAERFEVPVATTAKGKGVLAEDHPMSLGVLGFGAETYLLDEKVDLLLVVGASPGAAIEPGCRVIQIDTDPAVIGRGLRADRAVVADARLALEALAEAGQEPAEPVRRFWEPPGGEGPAAPGEPMSAPDAVRALSESLPADALFFCDPGDCVDWAARHHQVREPGTFFVGSGLDATGYAGPAAIGAKLAVPARPVVALLDDAAFARTGAEIGTAVANDVPVVWVVLNNGGYGLCYTGDLELLDQGTSWDLFAREVDVSALAAGYAARTATATTAEELRTALADAFTAGAPAVLDVRVTS